MMLTRRKMHESIIETLYRVIKYSLNYRSLPYVLDIVSPPHSSIFFARISFIFYTRWVKQQLLPENFFVKSRANMTEAANF